MAILNGICAVDVPESNIRHLILSSLSGTNTDRYLVPLTSPHLHLNCTVLNNFKIIALITSYLSWIIWSSNENRAVETDSHSKFLKHFNDIQWNFHWKSIIKIPDHRCGIFQLNSFSGHENFFSSPQNFSLKIKFLWCECKSRLLSDIGWLPVSTAQPGSVP